MVRTVGRVFLLTADCDTTVVLEQGADGTPSAANR